MLILSNSFLNFRRYRIFLTYVNTDCLASHSAWQHVSHCLNHRSSFCCIRRFIILFFVFFVFRCSVSGKFNFCCLYSAFSTKSAFIWSLLWARLNFHVSWWILRSYSAAEIRSWGGAESEIISHREDRWFHCCLWQSWSRSIGWTFNNFTGQDVSLDHPVQTGLWVHPDFNVKITGTYFTLE